MDYLIILISFLFASFFVVSEFAMVKVRPSALKEAQEQGDKRAKLALDMLDKLNEYLSTVQVGITVTGLVVGWVGEEAMSKLLGFVLPKWMSLGLTTLISLLLLTYLEVVLTELVPKSLAINDAKKITLAVARPLHIVHLIFFPLVWVMNESANGILHLMGKQLASEDSDSISQREIVLMSKDAVKTGALDDLDVTYMTRGFKFNDKCVKDIMVKKDDMDILSLSKGTIIVDDIARTMLKKGYTRFPVKLGKVYVGYIYSKDIWKHDFAEKETLNIQDVIHPIIQLDKGTDLNKAMKSMKNEQSLISLVTDNGEVVGLVTMEDIVEEFVGNIEDEND